MKTKAVRLYGKDDFRLEEFELPEIRDDEILVKVLATSLSVSSSRATATGPGRKRVPGKPGENPIMIGPEMSGEIVEVGDRWMGQYKVGTKFTLQPLLNSKGYQGGPGFAGGSVCTPYCGGGGSYSILSPEVMERDALLPYEGENFFSGILSEPYSCVIGACRALYRTGNTDHNHFMGIKHDGRMAIFGDSGPMGLAAVEYALSGEFRPRQIIVADVDEALLERARQLFHAKAEAHRISLIFVSTAEMKDAQAELMALTNGEGFNDVLVMVAEKGVLELAERLLSFNGCMNFFAAPRERKFRAKVNYYDIRYTERHIIGASGGTVGDMREAMELMEKGLIRPGLPISHIGGLEVMADRALKLSMLPEGKKLIYTGISLPLTALDELEEKGRNSPVLAELAKIVEAGNGLWSTEAEEYLLSNGEVLQV